MFFFNIFCCEKQLCGEKVLFNAFESFGFDRKSKCSMEKVDDTGFGGYMMHVVAYVRD